MSLNVFWTLGLCQTFLQHQSLQGPSNLDLRTKTDAIFKLFWVEITKMDDGQNTNQASLQSTFVRITGGWVSIGLYAAGPILVGLRTLFKYSMDMLTAQITCSATIIFTEYQIILKILLGKCLIIKIRFPKCIHFKCMSFKLVLSLRI